MIELILISALILALRLEGVFGADEAILARADEVLAVGGDECFADEGGVFGLAVLKKCALESLFTRIAGDIDFLAREGVDSRCEHNG